MSGLHVVTGAYGYTGREIARRLLALGVQVRTLTNHPRHPDPFEGKVEVFPLAFHDPDLLARALEGAEVLYNTYWIRFPRGDLTYERAVRNSERLFRAAERAGVARVVHISITHADPTSPLPYFRGKGEVEALLQDGPFSWAILRPTVIFGRGDVLINNIAWFLRRFPVFGLPGTGAYPLQPVYVGDVAELAVAAAFRRENQVLEAAGPEVYTFRELVELLARTLGRRPRLLPLPPRLAWALTALVGMVVRDVVLTWDEVRGLMAGLLVAEGTAAGRTSFRAWLQAHAQELGRTYASELARHYRPSFPPSGSS